MTVLSTHSLSLRCGSRLLFDRLNLQVHAGEVWAVLGVSGQGKSALLRHLAHLPMPAVFQVQGELNWRDKPPTSYRRAERAQMVAWMPQQDFQPFECTVAQRVLVGRYPHGSTLGWESREDLALLSEALEQVGLKGFESRVFQSLSGGEQRRVSMAAALVQQASLMLLDEPLSQLDWHHQVDLVRLFKPWAAKAGGAVVWVSHDPNMALQFSSHCLALMPSGEHLTGPVNLFRDAGVLSRVYDCAIGAVRPAHFYFPVADDYT